MFPLRPILWQIGPIRVYSYGFFLALAFLVSTGLTARRAKAQGIEPDHVVDLALVSCIASLIGARLGFVLLELPYYRLHPMEIIRFGEGGLSFHGGLILGVGVGIWFCLRRGIDAWKMIDLVAPAVALGTGIARIGCLLNGCCYGYVTDLPMGMPVALGDPSLRHPTQIYEGVLDIALFFYLYTQRNHDRFPGYLGFVYVILYSVLRTIVEIFRESRYLFGPIKIAQAFSLLLIISASIAIHVLDHGYQKKKQLEGQRSTP